jgi:hypothetical protein
MRASAPWLARDSGNSTARQAPALAATYRQDSVVASGKRGACRNPSHDADVSPRSRAEGTMAKDHGPQIKDDEQYEALRKQGASKEKAARIANTGRHASKRGGRSPAYEDWTKDDLYRRAKEIGIEGRSRMSKGQLIDAIRHH